ncbi:hypothetical protein CDAR_117581 [Caerostris darwini]|uniref:Uncharacterized protein n=1 Tax=Caerostris darwini TaxID=1538125 RepID=A0AAV4WKI9_9ARAC|nr:hypothetical protein CDAR_117581 [Caerostris darwini]
MALPHQFSPDCRPGMTIVCCPPPFGTSLHLQAIEYQNGIEASRVTNREFRADLIGGRFGTKDKIFTNLNWFEDLPGLRSYVGRNEWSLTFMR